MEKETRQLFIRFLNNQCTVEEQQKVNRLLENDDMLQLLYQLMKEKDDAAEQNDYLPNDDFEAKQLDWQQRIDQRIAATKDRSASIWNIRSRSWIRYSAIFIGAIIIAGLSVHMFRQSTTDDTIAVQDTKDILPGSDKALLTLSDGRTISLSDAETGKTITQTGADIQKTNDGEIVYKVGNEAASADTYNRIVIPNGGQYRVTLPDGSKAWLNSASSLTYPVHFSEKERRVKMTGEVYFEIAKKTNRKNERIPFFVETDKQEIQVLGTQFNVTAYVDEPQIKTTLVEGSVRVTNTTDGQSVLLKPGQQSILNEELRVEYADIKQQLAWKNGEFIFKEDYLGNIFKQVSRWYDVKVDCPAHLEKRKFSGMVSRSTSLSTLIKMIESTREIKITIRGRRLIVSE